jgi:protein tyrosine phosphatase (PTP) superfamily phosphohydrolase (DUF442 family)
MGGRVGHPAAPARWAEAATLARIRHQPVLPAGIAAHAQKAAGQNSTIHEQPQFAFHKPGHGALALLLPGQESLKLFGHYAIQNGLFWISRAVR